MFDLYELDGDFLATARYNNSAVDNCISWLGLDDLQDLAFVLRKLIKKSQFDIEDIEYCFENYLSTIREFMGYNRMFSSSGLEDNSYEILDYMGIIDYMSDREVDYCFELDLFDDILDGVKYDLDHAEYYIITPRAAIDWMSEGFDLYHHIPFDSFRDLEDYVEMINGEEDEGMF